jgi:hypothetical protein
VTHCSVGQSGPDSARSDDQAFDAEGLRHPAALKKLVSMTERSSCSGVFSGAPRWRKGNDSDVIRNDLRDNGATPQGLAGAEPLFEKASSSAC